MFIRALTPETHDALLAEAASVLERGGVVLFPTDTLYCLGADALSDAAVEKVYAIKGRDEKKPMHALVADTDMAARYGHLEEKARDLLAKTPPGKLSLVVPRLAESPRTGILSERDSFGFRIPDHSFAREIAQVFGKPITATSANSAGAEPPRSFGGILAQLGNAIGLIDLAIDAGPLPETLASTVVRVIGKKIEILREGAVPNALLEQGC